MVGSFQKVFREVDLAVSDDFIEERVGIGSRNIIIDALKASNLTFDDRLVTELLDKKIKAEIVLASKVRLFDGAKELLVSLNGRMKVALATMNNRAIIIDLLDRKKIGEYFDVIVTADEVMKPKPDPEIFHKAAAELKCVPQKCAVLEDSIFGVEAAKAAGMRCIAISSSRYSLKELQKGKPDLIVPSLKETAKILSFIHGTNSRQMAATRRTQSGKYSCGIG